MTRVHGDLADDGLTYYCRRCDEHVALDHDHGAFVGEAPGAKTGWRDDLRRVERALTAAKRHGRGPWVRNVFLERAAPELDRRGAKDRTVGSSVWSACGLYRYALAYTWSPHKPIAVVVDACASREAGDERDWPSFGHTGPYRPMLALAFDDLYSRGFGGFVVVCWFAYAVADGELERLAAVVAKGVEPTGGELADQAIRLVASRGTELIAASWRVHHDVPAWAEERRSYVMSYRGPLEGAERWAPMLGSER